MNLAPVLKQRFFDADGAPLSGGKLYSYAAGTTTPQVTYSDPDGTTNTNPVVLDANGYADVWLDTALSYKFVLKDSDDVTQWTRDNVASVSVGIATWSSNSTYSKGDIVSDGSEFGLLYVSLVDNNEGNALTDVSSWRIYDGNTRSVTADTTLLVTDNLIRSDSSSGSLTHTLPTASTTPIGKQITVVDIGTSGNTSTCNGLALSNGTAATFMNNGSSWDNISDFGTPAGVILPFGGATAPSGFLACDGSAVSRTTYAKLFSAIGTGWGTGDGTTTFNVPDLRGRALIGAGTGSGLSARTLGTQNIGEETHILSTGEMPSHNHGGATGGQSADHVHGYTAPAAAGFAATGVDGSAATSANTGGTSNDHTHSIASQGGGAAFNVMQPSAVVNWIIKT